MLLLTDKPTRKLVASILYSSNNTHYTAAVLLRENIGLDGGQGKWGTK